ncbi:MAG: hypothetical protein QM516_13925, partial [Limnohabitans sp.]|nr:hypothetical protein [Limnohabitans sp.]
YSVIYGTERALDRVRLENAVREELNLKEDQLLILDLGSNEEATREAATVLGTALPEPSAGLVVI